MQGFYTDEKNGEGQRIDTKIFYHTVLYFLNSYMKFENNFIRFKSGQGNEEIRESGEINAFELPLQKSLTQSIRFDEEELGEMNSQSYLVQDSDQFIKMLRTVMETNL